ncbi:G-protein coupled estrogen receptor 1-like [Hypomesus transpacificus]|uniref:G-protein coupled estrogen receptor 1-like n=1 Tax=Hypomesus transpacificus TaxID=137520 RepID=UPI001F0846E8|nr:G-protein coupled estrogen receptor 1-like [Hypomesus transpacificus]
MFQVQSQQRENEAPKQTTHCQNIGAMEVRSYTGSEVYGNSTEGLNGSSVRGLGLAGEDYDHASHYAISLFLSCLYTIVLFPVGFVGNILIIVVNLGRRGRMTAPDLYFVNLAVADLVLVADSLIEVFNLSEKYYDMAALCTFMALFFQVNMYSSVFFLTWMSFDRLVVLAGSTRLGRSMPRARLSCCLIWALSALLTLLPFTAAQIQHAGELHFCFANVSQIQWLEVTLGFLVPFCVLGGCYWKIARLLARAQQENGALQHRHQPRRQKTLRIIAAAVLVFFLCWLPENVFVSVHLLRGDSEGTLWHDYPLTAHIVNLAAFANSCLNPLIYSFVGDTFQDKVRLFVKENANWDKLHRLHSTNSNSLQGPSSCRRLTFRTSTHLFQSSNCHPKDTHCSSNSNSPQLNNKTYPLDE